jgi:hypothetical protein
MMTEEYEYEADMEATYALDLLKLYRRTVADRKFNVVIVDAPNLAASQLAEFWEAGQKAGYEIYMAQVRGMKNSKLNSMFFPYTALVCLTSYFLLECGIAQLPTSMEEIRCC